MTKDGPPSGRMGFGYQQAMEAGAPYQGPKSSAAANLAQLLVQHPQLRRKAAAMIKNGERAGTVLLNLQNSGKAGHFWLDLYRGADGQEWARYWVSDDEPAVKQHIDWGLEVGAYTRANLYRFNVKTRKWDGPEEYRRKIQTDLADSG
jgi:hypothetical protein